MTATKTKAMSWAVFFLLIALAKSDPCTRRFYPHPTHSRPDLTFLASSPNVAAAACQCFEACLNERRLACVHWAVRPAGGGQDGQFNCQLFEADPVLVPAFTFDSLTGPVDCEPEDCP